MASTMLDRISLLLKHAEGTSNEAEAAAFVEKAQKLAAANAIDLAVARSHQAAKDRVTVPIQRQISINGPRNSLARYIELFSAIAGHNDVVINIAHNNSYVIAFGFPSDIDVVEALYTSLLVQMAASAEAWLKTGEYKQEIVRTLVKRRNTVWGGYDYDYVTKPVDGRVARASFYDAFRLRISERLREARQAAKAEALAAEVERTGVEVDEESSETGLVLVGKSVEVSNFYKEASTARGSWKGSSSSCSSRSGRSAGSTAGSNARLSAQGNLGGSRKALR